MRIGLLASLGLTLDAFFRELTVHWESEGHSVFPAAGTPSTFLNTEVIQGITRRPSPRNIIAPRSIEAWCRNNDLDVILTNTATASALARLKRMPVPVVYFCHGLHWNADMGSPWSPWRLLEKHLLRNTSGVITINSDDEEWFRKGTTPSSLLRVPSGVGVPLDRYPHIPIPEAKTADLLWIGEFSERKRPEAMIRVAQLLKAVQFPFKLTMLGDGPRHAAICALVQEQKLSAQVELPGRSPVQDAITRSTLLVHTAQWEGLPRVLLEGYAMGRRAIAFDVKGVRDIPEVILVEEGNVTAFANTIMETFNQSHLLAPSGTPDWLDSRYVADVISKFLANSLGTHNVQNSLL